MKTIYIHFILIFIIISSCSVDYDFDNANYNEPELIIINSLLNPHDPIQIQLYKLQRSEKQFIYKALQGAKVILKENQTVLYDAICKDSILFLDYYPKVNKEYSIEVSYNDLKTVTATTTIPSAISCIFDFEYDDIYNYSSSYIITLKSFVIPSDSHISLWITAYRSYENASESQYNELYTNNVLVDKRNSTMGMGMMNNTVGSIYYNGFLRVKNKNLPLITELYFTPNFVYIEDYIYLEEDQTHIKVKLITASIEYDHFQKSLYDQKSMIYSGDDFSSIFYQPTSVYSNIENGLGIFAAVNETIQVIKLPVIED